MSQSDQDEQFPAQSPLPANVADANSDTKSGLALGGRRAFAVTPPPSPDAMTVSFSGHRRY